MTESRPLRGGCQCGRNRYIIAIPDEGIKDAQVVFNTAPAHQIPLATPLAAYIRVPLSWYHSTTHSYFEDETHTMIRRVYTHPTQEHSKRHFCGFCGTPLSYWSESPMSEAEYINLTLGSLMQEDLADLEDMGLLSESDSADDEGEEDDSKEIDPASTTVPAVRTTALRASYSVPWFERLVEGRRLSSMTHSHGIKRTQDGKVKIEWEVVEFNGDEDTDMEDPTSKPGSSATSAKRKREGTSANSRT